MRFNPFRAAQLMRNARRTASDLYRLGQGPYRRYDNGRYSQSQYGQVPDQYYDPYDQRSNNGRGYDRQEYTQTEWERIQESQRIYQKWGRLAPFYIYRKPIGIVLGGFGVIYVTHLERAPISGRLRFMIVPRWLELKIGEDGYQETSAQFGPYSLPDWHPTTKFIRRTMDRIIAVADMEPMDWKVHVVRGNFPPNAFVLPGGKVFVFESSSPICANQDGLATVSSHETAHQVCRHTAEASSKTPIKWMSSMASFAITGIGSVDNVVTRLAFELPGSRAMEKEADLVGSMMMAKACFHPDEAVNLWQRMSKAEQSEGIAPPEFLSTHPASGHRIELIKEHLPEADKYRNQNCTDMADFTSYFRGN